MDAKTEQSLKDFAKESAEKNKKAAEAVAAPEVAVPAVEKPIEAPKKTIDELSDDELKDIVAKRGIVKPEEKKKSDEEILTESLNYGVQKDSAILDKYNTAVKYNDTPDKNVVYEKFAEKAKSKNPKLTDQEIETRFNKKYAAEENVEEIHGDEFDTERVTDRKVTYVLDEDELKQEADKIRNDYWNPINKVKEEYSQVSKQKDLEANFIKDVERLKKDIPSKITFDLGDEKNPNTFEYAVDDTFRSQVEQGVISIYANHRQAVINGKEKEEDFNIKSAAQFAAQTLMFKNILLTYGAGRESEGEKKALKVFNNPHTQTLETKEVSNAKVIPTDAEQMRNIGRQLGWR